MALGMFINPGVLPLWCHARGADSDAFVDLCFFRMEIGLSWHIGIDFGMKHWGLARGIHGVVEPIGSISAVGGMPDWDALHAMVKSWSCGVWVIGIPLDSSGELLLPGRVLKRHRRVIAKHLGGKLLFIDESLTTIEARARLMEQTGKIESKAAIDAMSACLILERYYSIHGLEL